MMVIAFALLNACSGGGHSTPPRASQSDYLVPVSIWADGPGGNKVLILDPDAPTPPRGVVVLAEGGNYSTENAYDIDVARGEYTQYGSSQLFHVKDGQVFRTSLHKTDPTVARRISSLDSACTTGMMAFGWLTVYEAGPDGRCDTWDDNRLVRIRGDAPPSQPAKMLPEGVVLLEVLPDERLREARFHIARDTRGSVPKLTLYTSELEPAGDVAGGAGLSELKLKASPGRPTGRSWAYDGVALRAITWSASGATLAPAVHTFRQRPAAGASPAYAVDDGALYVLDGHDIVRVAGNGPAETLATLDPRLGDVWSMGLTSADSLIIHQYDGSSSAISRVRKQGGERSVIATGEWLHPVRLIGDDLLYVSYVRAPDDSETSTLYRIGLDGRNSAVLIDRADQDLAWVWSTVTTAAYVGVDGFLWCERAPGESNCRNGTVRSLDLRTNTTTVLGKVSPPGDASAYVTWTPFTYDPLLLTFDSPWLLRSSSQAKIGSTPRYDVVFTARPGVAGSLKQVWAAP